MRLSMQQITHTVVFIKETVKWVHNIAASMHIGMGARQAHETKKDDATHTKQVEATYVRRWRAHDQLMRLAQNEGGGLHQAVGTVL